jgi:choline dehydrogenase-like flavoprotein
MATQVDFTRDVVGRYTCNTMEEARQSTQGRPDARPFDVIVIGGGSFGAIFAQHMFYRDTTHSHRILVLDGGPLVLPEHVQNLPMLGLNVPFPPVTQDPGQIREQVWGMPWRANTGFPGLAYCLGGRSLFFGGWSPQLLEEETPTTEDANHPYAWPKRVVDDLRHPLPSGDPSYFRQAAEQIGTNETNDFIHGELHEAMRQQLLVGIEGHLIPDAIPLGELPLHLDVPPRTSGARKKLLKLEAPLAVQGSQPRSGFFPLNKFSSVPLLIEAARLAWQETVEGLPGGTIGDDVRKRFMIVPNCRVIRLLTDINNGVGRVREVQTEVRTPVLNSDIEHTRRVNIAVPDHGVVIIALGTIESTRLALLSFEGTSHYDLIGQNLMAHLRSNLTIRIPREALTALDPTAKDLQTSSLFLKGRHIHGDGSKSYFHLQITGVGLGPKGTDADAESFKKIPDIDLIHTFRSDDSHVAITLRGIGEMRPQNSDGYIKLATDQPTDEVGVHRALVHMADPRDVNQRNNNPKTAKDAELWDAMDAAADAAAKVFAGTASLEVLNPNSRRDGLGTTHHEAGPLWMGDDPNKSVTNADARLHSVENAYVAGPATFPSVGSPNPMLTGTAMARRLADHLAQALLPEPLPVAEPGFFHLFDGTEASFKRWRRAGFWDGGPGTFVLVNGAIVAYPGEHDHRLFFYAERRFNNFILRLQFRLSSPSDNSGVFVRFRNPLIGYPEFDPPNRADVAVITGFEVQIDELGAPDNLDKHRTGAVYNIPTGQQGEPAQQNYQRGPALQAGQWYDYEIEVNGDLYIVRLNGQQTTVFANQDPNRGRPASQDSNSGYIGVQAHPPSTALVAFRNVRIKEI